MTRNMLVIILVFSSGLVCIFGGYLVFLSAISDSPGDTSGIQETPQKSHKIRPRQHGPSAREENSLREQGKRALSIAEAVKRFEEEQRKEQGPESEQEARRKKFHDLVNMAARDLDGDPRSDVFRSELDKLKRGEKPDPEVYDEIIRRHAEKNETRLRKAEREGRFQPDRIF